MRASPRLENMMVASPAADQGHAGVARRPEDLAEDQRRREYPGAWRQQRERCDAGGRIALQQAPQIA